MGGVPGEPGSGNASTGAHLHYQVEVIGGGAESLRGDADEWWDTFSNQQSNTSAIGNLIDPAYLLSIGDAYDKLGFEIGNQPYRKGVGGLYSDREGYLPKSTTPPPVSQGSVLQGA